MSVPGIVQSALDGEEIAARVSLGGDDELFITPSSTLRYSADGLLSDESVDEFPHDADRLTLAEKRRKTRFTLEYALDGPREFTVPGARTDDVLHPVLAGVLGGNGITEPGETVLQTYRFSELTLVITSDRLVKHVGEAVWDEDYEQYHFGDVTRLTFEDGSVATQIVLEVDGRQQRIKTPNDDADDVGERLKRALCSYHDAASLEAFNERGDDEAGDADGDPSAAFGDGVDPLDADPPALDDEDRAGGAADGSAGAAVDPLADGTTVADRSDVDPHAHGDDGGDGAVARANADGVASGPGRTPSGSGPSSGGDGAVSNDSPRSRAESTEADTRATESSQAPAGGTASGAADGTATTGERSFEESGFEPATPDGDPELLERLDTLEATVDRQTELLEKQQRTIEQLIEELRQGR